MIELNVPKRLLHLHVTDEELAKRAEYLSTQAKDDPILFIHKNIGFNYRMTNLQAAVGVAQLETKTEFIAAKKEINARYREALEGMSGVSFMGSADWADNGCWLTTIRIDPTEAGITNLQLMRVLARGDNGNPRIETRLLWQPMHRSEALEGSYRTDAPVTDAIYAEALSLPSSVGLSKADQERVIAALWRHLKSR